MPQEILRDVLRTGDANGRSRRRWAMLPISLAAHAVVVVAVLIMPLAADVVGPVPASPRDIRWVTPIGPPPSPPAARAASTAPQPQAAPSEAPSEIHPEPERAPIGPPGPVIDGAIGSPNEFPSGFGPALSLPDPPPPPASPVKSGPVPVGQGVRQPRKIVDVAPVYPAIAQSAHIQGDVVLEAVLDEHGRVDRVRVLKSEPLLDQAAIAAVRQWRYTPTLLNNVPVSVLMTITIHFQLRE